MLSSFSLTFLVGIAVVNGVNIVTNRVLNARLGMHKGHLRSSLWNHIVGAVFLLPIVLWMGQWQGYLKHWADVPVIYYTGGLLGVVFVWMINWVMPRLGALQSMLILLSSQMVFGLLFDIVLKKIHNVPMAVLGIALILFGVVLGTISKSRS